ncbi:MAG: hypothetical protein OXN89_25310 [Bryobacterales bacterium]|nr:hypothetical protein [Bryobacterales bacterium]
MGSINREVVREGLRLAGWQDGEQLRVRCDSYVVETNVEYPTDYRLLPDALLGMVREAACQCCVARVPAWRQEAHWKGKGEKIPHEEKGFSIHEEHTRWVSKGKAGQPVELRVPVGSRSAGSSSCQAGPDGGASSTRK